MPSQLIVEYENMVYKMAQRFYGSEREDLIQAGFLGLLKAYKNFKPESSTKFSTYAYEYIYGEMYETVNGYRPIKLRKENLKIYKDVTRAKELYTQKYEREVSYEETCSFLGIEYALFIDILNSLNTSISIENTELNLGKKESIDDLILLKEALGELSTLEKSVIKNRFIKDKSQTETAKILGLSQVKVSRIEKQSKEKMKEFIAA